MTRRAQLCFDPGTDGPSVDNPAISTIYRNIYTTLQRCQQYLAKVFSLFGEAPYKDILLVECDYAIL